MFFYRKGNIMPQTFYEVVWIFIIYAFIGWCTEVSYAALDTGKFVNRGFLNGPYCPIYGCGVLLVIVVLTPLKGNLLILFFGSVVLTSVIEFITGYLLETVFHNKWWDYSNKPYNIKGYICLKFSLFWGFACTFIMLIIHPIIYGFIKFLPFIPGLVILCIIMVFFAIDCGITVATILKFNERLKMLNEIGAKIHHISDGIGENIYENVTEALEKMEEFKETHEEQIIKITEKKDELTEGFTQKKDELTEGFTQKKDELTEGFTQKKDEIAGNIAEKTQEVKLGREVRKIENKMEMERLKKQYYELMEEKILGANRLMKAFPGMSSKNHNEAFQKFRDYRFKNDKKKD